MMFGGQWKRLAIPALSGVIALIWLSQFTVSVPLHLIARGLRRSWPIIDYPMYSGPHFEGDQISRLAVVGIRDNAEEIDILPEDIGGGYCHFKIFATAVKHADKEVIQDVVRMYEARRNVRLAAIRVENRPLLWKSKQVEAVPTEVLRTYPLNNTEEKSPIP